MSTDKKKFFGKHKEGGKLKGSNVYVSDVSGATVKMTEAIADYVGRVYWGSPCATW
jgi:hypothetical protein